MVWVWWGCGALAGAWDGQSADVVAKRTIAASPEAIHAALDDWNDWRAILPADCAEDWNIVSAGPGVGSQAEAFYAFGPRRGTKYGAIKADEPGRVLEIEQLGKRGWFTQVTYAAAGSDRTEVTLTTPLGHPKWPFAGVFFRKIKPAWEGCYARALEALEARVAEADAAGE